METVETDEHLEEILDVLNEDPVSEPQIEVAPEVPQVTEKPKKSTRSKSDRIVQIPLSRVKQIMKFDPDVHITSSDSVYLLAKAAELFIATLTKEAYTYTAAAKKKTIQKKDVDSAIANAEAFAFLEGMLET